MYVAALIHIEHLLNSARGRGGTFHPIPFIHVSVHRLMRLLVTQCIAHILGAEERFALFENDNENENLS